jgi:tRNA A-37 threonylcarbamoyl transferase component Bud32
LALVDRDGLHLPLVEPFWTTDVVSAAEYRPGYRHNVVIVDFNGDAGILKNFRGKTAEFVNELEAALALHEACCNVPDVLHVDFDQLYIIYSYIQGPNLRVILKSAGADFQRQVRPGFRRAQRRPNVEVEHNYQILSQVLDQVAIQRIWSGLTAVHDAGFTLEDIKYGNIIIHEKTGTPIFIDFERALSLGKLSPRLAKYMRDKETMKLNWILGPQNVTAIAR